MTSDDMKATPLKNLTVIDASTSVSGQYCGKLLASAGANVVLVEPPTGTATRRAGPFTVGRAPPDSLLFRHLNEGKQSVTLDLATQSGLSIIRRLCATADVFIHDQGVSFLPSTVRLITCEVGDFPLDGPYAGWGATEMIVQAMSGAMFPTGRPDRQPLYGIGRRAAYACGVVAFATTMAALFERIRSGRGQIVRATVYETAVSMNQNLVSQYEYSRTYPTRERYEGLLAKLECQDGWIVIMIWHDSWPSLCSALGLERLMEDERFRGPAALQRNWGAAVEALQPAARRLLTEQIVERAIDGRYVAEKVWSLGDLVESEQWRVRGMVRHWPGASTALPTYSLGPMFHLGPYAFQSRGPAPVLGSDTATRLAQAGFTPDEVDQLRSGGIV